MEQYHRTTQYHEQSKGLQEKSSTIGPLDHIREQIGLFDWSRCDLFIGKQDSVNIFRDKIKQICDDPMFEKFNKYITGEPVIVLEEIIALAIQETGLDDTKQGGKGESGYFQIKPEEKSRIGVEDPNKAGLIRWLQVKSNWLFSFDKLEKNGYLGSLSGEQKQQLIYLSYNRGSIIKGIIRECAKEKTPVTFTHIMDKWYSTQEHRNMKQFQSPQFSNFIITESEVYFGSHPIYGETEINITVNPSENSQLFGLLFPGYTTNPSYALGVNDKRIGNKYMIQVKKITTLLKQK